MIISRTPFRVSLFGGGTDHPAWFRDNGGAVLGMAINKYCYISVRRLPPFFTHRSRVVYSQVELVHDVSEIKHPVVRNCLLEMGIDEGLEIHHDADLPARSGLGSSSSFTVGMLNALNALQSRMVTKQELAREAIRIEQDVLKEKVGCQDQLWAAYGGLNRIDFGQDGSFDIRRVMIRPERVDQLLASAMLFFTGFSRFSSDFAGKQVENIKNRTAHLSELQQMVDEALSILTSQQTSMTELGELLHQSWLLKRELADTVSTPLIDEIYQAGREAGAIGGKLLGAGGGGFMLFIVDPQKTEAVRERLKDLVLVNFGIDTAGSKIVMYNPDGF